MRLGDEPVPHRHRAPGGIIVGRPQRGHQQVRAAEDVQRQIAVLLVVAVEEASLRVAVQRVIGGIQIQDDFGRRGGMGVQKQVHEQPLDGLGAGHDLVVAAVGGGLRRGQLQAVEGALAGQGFALGLSAEAIRAGGIGLAHQGGQQGVEAEGIVVVEVFIAQGQAVDALADQL